MYLFFSFWLTWLYMTVSRSIHISTSDPVFFFPFYGWVVFLCIYVQSGISVAQSCPTLCYPMDCSMPSFPVYHQLPEPTLNSISSLMPSNYLTQSCLCNPMEFSRPEYWSGKPFPSPGELPTQGLNPGLPHCRQILYQLNPPMYIKGSPYICTGLDNSLMWDVHCQMFNNIFGLDLLDAK